MSHRDMMQFGKANERLMDVLARANPKFGPCYMYKVDISDGFYRVPLSTTGSLKLGVCLPALPDVPGEALVAFPLDLPMGWTESPPFFCAFTETACDLANQDLRKNVRAPPHPLEDRAAAGDFLPNPDKGHDVLPVRPVRLSHQARLFSKPVAYNDIFMDDFVGIGQQHKMNPLPNQRRVLMHRVDGIFRPSDSADGPHRQEPISVKKLDKQDTSWQDLKRCLGWDYGTRSNNLCVAPHRKDKALQSIQAALSQKRVGLTEWQSLLGQLRSLTAGVPGMSGQFSLLQAGLTGVTSGRIRITPALREQLRTCKELLDSDEIPTTIEELVPGEPQNIGACDAAKPGMGGVWFRDTGGPLLWRTPFPAKVQAQLVSEQNPKGRITNSDLELAGTIMHQDVLADHTPVAGETIHTFCDNTPAVAWRTKGSTTSTKSTAYLLRIAALMQRNQRCHHTIEHISGDDNRMADDASRLWELSDAELLTYFNSTYPQTQSWQLCQPNKHMSSVLISTLSRGTSHVESVRRELSQPRVPGPSGLPSAGLSISTRDSATSPTRCLSSSSLPAATATVASHPLGTRSALAQRRTPYVRWARRSPYWASVTRA
jgi:hypothetical protein